MTRKTDLIDTSAVPSPLCPWRNRFHKEHTFKHLGRMDDPANGAMVDCPGSSGQPWVISLHEVEDGDLGANVGTWVAPTEEDRDRLVDRCEKAWPTLRVVVQRASDPAHIPAS